MEKTGDADICQNNAFEKKAFDSLDFFFFWHVVVFFVGKMSRYFTLSGCSHAPKLVFVFDERIVVVGLRRKVSTGT